MRPDRADDVGGAAAEDLHPPNVEQLVGGHLDAAEMGGLETRFGTAAQSAAHRVRLLDDFLPHEMVEGALFQGLAGPGDRCGRLCRRATVEREGLKAVGTHDRNLAVVEVNDTAGMRDESRRIGGDKHLVLADTQHHRPAIARDDHDIRVLSVEHGKGIGSGHEMQRLTHGVHQRGPRHSGDQVWQHLGVGIRTENHAFGAETSAELGRVFYDAVVDDGKPA